ncbi:MAG: ABC transporter permease [Ginsengibacter sp.]
MFRNDFKITLRNLWRNKTYSLLNNFGLALGIASSLLIILWVQDERSVDAFHENSNQLYTIFEKQYYDGKKEATYSTPALMADELKRVLPEVLYASGYSKTNLNTFEANNKIIKEAGNYAGADFFKMFSYRLLQGNAQAALNTTTGIAVSRKMAQDFFGDPENAIGKIIRFQNQKDLKITAVFENLPAAVSDKFDYIINWDSFLEEHSWAKDWGNNATETFIMLRSDAHASKVNTQLTHFLDNYNKDQGNGFRIECSMQRFDDMYLHSNFKNGEIAGGRIDYVNLFSIVALFVLLIACINFMNLTTARSVKRAKEIGVRKVVGAMRSAIIRQFMAEAIMISFFAAILALLIVFIALPAFNSFTGKQIQLPLHDISFWLSLLAVILITGVISGSYPALLLSSFNPVKVLKGKFNFSNSSILFRKGLIVFQFILSAIFITATIIISRQSDYIQTKNLGYNRDNLLYITLEGELAGKYNLFKAEAAKVSGVQFITRMSDAPTDINSSTGGVQWTGKDPNLNVQFTAVSVGYDFAKTMDVKMLQGRDYSKDFSSDSSGYILNEAAVKKTGYKDAQGKPLTLWGNKGIIIGVMQDFHFNSLHVAVKPMILHFEEQDDGGVALVRIKAGKTKQALTGLETICKNINPKFPFTYLFSDESYSKLYKSEQIVGKLSDLFAMLAIFISCLGLLGLSIFTAQQRIKEISIRKILGAGVGSLFVLQSKEFLKLVIIACLIALPVAWYCMNKWLLNYEYRITVTWWMFAIPALMAITIALITVSFQAIKAAIANPVKSLRSE